MRLAIPRHLLESSPVPVISDFVLRVFAWPLGASAYLEFNGNVHGEGARVTFRVSRPEFKAVSWDRVFGLRFLQP